MKPIYCQYCGELLENGCDCSREIVMEKEEWLDEYYNRPDVQAGWHNQDLIENGHFNQR